LSSLEPSTPQQRTGRTFHLALSGAALAWSIAARLLSKSSAQGLSNRFNADWITPILGTLFLLFLLSVGYTLLDIIGRREASARSVLGLPKRPTAAREWLIGVALGWGMVVVAVTPSALAGDLHVNTWFTSRALLLLALNLFIAALTSLAIEAVYRGYPFRRLIDAIGPVAATMGMSIFFALSCAIEKGGTRSTVFIAFLTGIVFSISWLRTHGLWMAWGMRFGWMASMAIVFGLPLSGSYDLSSVIQTTAVGSAWVTGSDYGPEASFFMIFALIAGLIVLIRVTRQYAWDYTHPSIVPGGYPMDIAPPAAHTAMEKAAPPPLIQILPTTPQGRSVNDPPNS
jgi:membrane protease YdiL (CAAX protease family)